MTVGPYEAQLITASILAIPGIVMVLVAVFTGQFSREKEVAKYAVFFDEQEEDFWEQRRALSVPEACNTSEGRPTHEPVFAKEQAHIPVAVRLRHPRLSAARPRPGGTGAGHDPAHDQPGGAHPHSSSQVPTGNDDATVEQYYDYLNLQQLNTLGEQYLFDWQYLQHHLSGSWRPSSSSSTSSSSPGTARRRKLDLYPVEVFNGVITERSGPVDPLSWGMSGASWASTASTTLSST